MGKAAPVTRMCPKVRANQIAAHLVSMFRAKTDKEHSSMIKKELNLTEALKSFKPGKSLDLDGIHKELLILLSTCQTFW